MRFSLTIFLLFFLLSTSFALGEKDSIFLAAKRGDIKVIQEFLDKGVDIDVVDSEGWSPLMYAVKNKKLEACKFLLSKGAKANIKDKKGFGPLDYISLTPIDPNTFRRANCEEIKKLGITSFCDDLDKSKDKNISIQIKEILENAILKEVNKK